MPVSKRPVRSRNEALEKQTSSDGGGNRSVVVAVDVLKVLSRFNGPAQLQDIAVAANMSSSRVHRYLRGLVKTGLVEQDNASGRYSLGPTAVELGLIALGQADPVKLGNETLVQLTERTGLVSLLSLWGTYGPTIVKCEYGTLDTSVRIREGRTLPLLTTATGRVFLAHLAKAKWENIVRQELDALNARRPAKNRPSMKVVDTLRKEALAQGVGVMLGEENPGLAALAAPVYDHSGRLAMVLTVISIMGTFDTRSDGLVAQELVSHANQLSRRLGASLPEVRQRPQKAGGGLRDAAE